MSTKKIKVLSYKKKYSYQLPKIQSDNLLIKKKYFNYDFNDGFRIEFNITSLSYKILVMNKITRELYYEEIINPKENVIYTFPKKYYTEYEIIIFKNENIQWYENTFPLDIITYNDSKENVLIYISQKDSLAGLGDTIAWLTATYKFMLEHKDTNVYVSVGNSELETLILQKHPKFNFVSLKSIKKLKFYATYIMGCFFDDVDKIFCPIYYKDLSLVEMGYCILGVDIDKSFSLNLKLNYSENEPYVCIASHASSIYKEWLCKDGWENIVTYLNKLGYKVYVIDANEYSSTSNELLKTKIPKNAINKTGNIHILERAKLISGCDFFIGTSSGLSWLAWACNVPVILISGFTNPKTEFYTPHRIINYSVCNSCWNDHSIKWDMSKTVCPRKNNIFDNDYLECSTKIELYSVINAINNIIGKKLIK